ncbi:hypothetical protein ANCCAN_18300 [Ancylostoma caninum]|uniref:Uncharacterized protein n=1 Tax=Ancylostoma caninum TaxID=29170 RepID=A0A368FUE0_ANCCA|nr:hypothetical protein ANCCAN_18300 [Ancylostoma caninum]
MNSNRLSRPERKNKDRITMKLKEIRSPKKEMPHTRRSRRSRHTSMYVISPHQRSSPRPERPFSSV